MPKVEEFYHSYKRLSATRRKRLRCASETITLGILAHLLLLALFKDLEYYHWVQNVFLRWLHIKM
jgi:hypothetical protein